MNDWCYCLETGSLLWGRKFFERLSVRDIMLCDSYLTFNAIQSEVIVKKKLTKVDEQNDTSKLYE